MPHSMFCPREKKYSPALQNQRFIGIFMSLREKERESKSEGEGERERGRERARARAR
jgi:hypothetical protein